MNAEIAEARRSQPFRALARVELLMFLREPFAVFFTLVLPLALQLLFAAAFGNYDADGVPVSSLQLAGIALMVSSYLGLMGVPIVMAEYREMGVLRAFRIIPIRFRDFILAHVAVEIGMFVFSMAVCFAATALVFGLTLPEHPVQFALLVGACVALFMSLGFAIASLGTSPRTSQAIGAFLYFFCLFTSGASIPRDQLPDGLRTVFDWLPASILLDQLQDAWTGESSVPEVVVALTVTAVLGLVAATVAVRRFDTSVARAS